MNGWGKAGDTNGHEGERGERWGAISGFSDSVTWDVAQCAAPDELARMGVEGSEVWGGGAAGGATVDRRINGKARRGAGMA